MTPVLRRGKAQLSAVALFAIVVMLAITQGDDEDDGPGPTPANAAPPPIPKLSDLTPEPEAFLATPPMIDTPEDDDDNSDDGSKVSVAPTFASSFVHRDINHVLATGQSLSVGAVGYPALSTKQPYGNVMFRTGVIAGSAGLTSFVPLIEGPPFEGHQHVNDETMSSGFANLVTELSRDLLADAKDAKHNLLISAHGIGGIAYIGLRKGTPAYDNGVAQTKAALEIAKSRDLTYVVRAVTNVHGESDHLDNNTHYARNLAEWQADYERDVKAITHQREAIPMIHSQMSSWTRYGSATSHIPQQQLAATLASKGKLVLVGPKYNLQYTNDGIHLTNEGYRHMGEYYAKVYRRVILEGKAWEPLRPISVKRAGAVITIKLVVPAPPIVFDETLVANPGNSGFEYTDSSTTPPTIKSVAIASRDTITLTLSSEPAAGSRKRIRYAFTGTPGALAGAKSGARGNLRDSDATKSRHGYPLHNWCVHFDEHVP